MNRFLRYKGSRLRLLDVTEQEWLSGIAVVAGILFSVLLILMGIRAVYSILE